MGVGYPLAPFGYPADDVGGCGTCGGKEAVVAPRMGGMSLEDTDAAVGEFWLGATGAAPAAPLRRKSSSLCCALRASARLRLAARTASGS